LRVNVLLFASYAELAGRERLEVSVPGPATVADVVRQVRALVPGLDRLPDRPLAALNQAHVRLDAPVAEGDELALLPPLAGG
jgi:molybdopterin converting factor small subunit